MTKTLQEQARRPQAPTSFGAIWRPTLKDRIVSEVRRAILSGKLQPGARVVESRLARQMNVAQTSIREALADLIHQGFLIKYVNRHTEVRRLQAEDIEQLFRVRTELEGLAMELAQPHATPETLALLEAACEGMRDAVRQDRPVDFYVNDIEFHQSLWTLAGNEFLQRALIPMSVAPVAFVLTGAPIKWGATAEDHKEILQALRELSPNQCRRMMAERLERWREMNVALIEQRGP